MALIQCGAPARYLRLGIRQVDLGATGSFAISELAAYNSATSTTNLLASATLSVDHVVGVYEVTAPLDGSNNPILDGAVLVDNDPATGVTVNVADNTSPSAWFVTADFGAGNAQLAVEVEVTFTTDFRADLTKWVIHVETSDNGTDWRRVDSIQLRQGALGVAQRFSITGSGPLRLRQYNPRTGDGFITGIVSEDSAVKPNGRVVCLERDTMHPVAATLTDEYGGFTFWGLDTGRQYSIIALDDDGTPMKQPSSWDHITPTKGLRYGSLAVQTFHNRVKIANGWHVMGFYQFGALASDGLGVAAAEWWWDYNYQEPIPTNSNWYGGFTNPASRSISGLTPLRPDQPAYLFNSYDTATAKHQHPVLFVAPDSVSDKGLSVEMVLALESGATCEFKVFGFKVPNWSDWYHPDNYTGGYEAGIYSTGSYRDVGEILSCDISATQLVLYYMTSTMSSYATYTLPLPTGVDLADGVLHHLVVSMRVNDALEVFIDGVSVGTATLAGSGYIANYVKDNTRTSTVGSTSRGNVNGIKAVATGIAFADEFYTNARSLTGLHLACVAMYATGLTATQAADLNKEARGSYTDAAAVSNLTGHEAEVMARTPCLYMPLQDTAATTLNPVAAFPLPNRTVEVDNQDGLTVANRSMYKQSTIPDQVTSGLVTLAHTTTGSTRSWMRVTSGGNPHYAFSHGWGLPNPKERTLELWLQVVQAPAAGDNLVIKMVTNHEEYSGPTEMPDVPQTILQVLVDPNRALLVSTQAAAPADVPMTYNFSYTVPLNTPVHLAVVWDYAAGLATLYVNGAVQGTLSHSAFMQFDSVGRVQFEALGSGEFLVRDLAVYGYALTASEIQTLYNSGA